MAGHIHKREWQTKAGKKRRKYYAVVYLGYNPASGKKRYDWGTGHDTRREAERALVDRLAALGSGTYVATSARTLGEYLVDSWLPLAGARVKPTTWLTYQSIAHRHILPTLGRRVLQGLTADDVSAFYARLLDGDVPAQAKYTGRKFKPLSAKTVHNVHVVLNSVYNDAVDAGLVSQNPLNRVKPPRPVKPEIRAWTAEELNAFLVHIETHRFYAPLHLAAMTGMRRGEVLGVRWNDVDLKAGVVAVRQALVSVGGTPTITSPKSRKARVVDLDPETTEVLRQHRVRQAEQRLAWGPDYARSDLLFTNQDGRPIHPDVFTQTFARIVKASGLPLIRLHDLRHTHATIGLAGGIPVKVMSERLGHATAAFTMDVYQHVMPSMQAEAAAAIAAAVRGTSIPRGSETRGS